LTGDDVLSALDIPADAITNLRIPKTLLVKNSAAIQTDKRLINEGIEEIRWLSALKAGTISVPEYHDSLREYPEISVLLTILRKQINVLRLSELIHRSIPYPVFLVIEREKQLYVSLAHIRNSLSHNEETVLDGEIIITDNLADIQGETANAFLKSLSILKQPRNNTFTLYQGWIDTLLALAAARITGEFRKADNDERSEERYKAIRQYAQLEKEIKRLKAIAVKEKQTARLVELNRKLKEPEAELQNVRKKL